MLAKELYKFRESLESQGIVFCYSGFLTEKILAGIGLTIKQKLEFEGTDRKVSKGLFSIFVEQAQNVIRYSAEEKIDSEEPGKELRYGVLTMGNKGEDFFVSCGNLIKQKDVDRLSQSLAHIQSLDKAGLKALYKQILRGDVPAGSKGAGVGFVDIARSATKGFEYDFESMDEDYSYFCIKAYV